MVTVLTICPQPAPHTSVCDGEMLCGPHSPWLGTVSLRKQRCLTRPQLRLSPLLQLEGSLTAIQGPLCKYGGAVPKPYPRTQKTATAYPAKGKLYNLWRETTGRGRHGLSPLSLHEHSSPGLGTRAHCFPSPLKEGSQTQLLAPSKGSPFLRRHLPSSLLPPQVSC